MSGSFNVSHEFVAASCCYDVTSWEITNCNKQKLGSNPFDGSELP